MLMSCCSAQSPPRSVPPPAGTAETVRSHIINSDMATENQGIEATVEMMDVESLLFDTEGIDCNVY